MSDVHRELPATAKIGITAVVLPMLIYVGNPAVALLVGSALSLLTNAKIVPGSDKLGKYALQTAVILLGLKLNAAMLIQISADYSLMVTFYVLATLAVGFTIGRLLRNDDVSNQLISSGTAICGGTTIASLSPIIHARPDQTAVALTVVFLLNALALFTYPYIGEFLQLTQEQFGVWCALSIHDTSSVVATAILYGEDAGAVATTLKLGRTLWLIPLLVVASVMARQDARVQVPIFVLLFILSAMLGSFLDLPAWLTTSAGSISKALLVLALYCIGTDISRTTVRELRGATLVQGIALWLIAAPATLAAVYYLV